MIRSKQIVSNFSTENMKNSIFNKISKLRQRVRNVEYRYGRKPGSVQLIAISKAQNLESIKSAIAAGQRIFGESYVQEALEKIRSLQDSSLEWHFVGRMQTNKTKVIANNFSWVHSLADIKLASKLNEYRKKANLTPLNICIQVNLQKELSKEGIYLEHLISLAKKINKFSHLHLRGLMAIPKPENKFSIQRKNFKELHSMLGKLQALGLQLDTLSMGMSEDFEAAIAEGATLIRIGTAIFGKRDR